MLEVLIGTESGLGTSQIARLARRGTRPGHQLALDRLTEHGLVVAEPTNRGYLYRLNREHVLLPALLAARDARTAVFARLATALAELDPAPRHASVFGSFARGEGTEESDIDLLLVVHPGHDRQADEWLTQLRRLEDQVLAWTGNRLEILEFSEQSLAEALRNEEPIAQSLSQESIDLYGGSFATLTSTLAKPKAVAGRAPKS